MSERLQQLVEELAERLGRSVAVDDPGIQLVAASPHSGAIDPARLDVVLQRRTRPDLVAFVRTLGLPQVRGHRRVPGNPELELLPRIVWPLREDDELHGYLWLIDAPPVTPADIAATDAVVAEAGRLLGDRHRAADQAAARETSTVAALVGPDDRERDLALLDLHRSGRLRRDHPWQVLVLSGAGPGDLAGAVTTIRAALGGAAVAAVDDAVVVVTDDPAWLPRADAPDGGRPGLRVRAALAGRGLAHLRTGSCTVAAGADLPAAHRRARCAADVATHLAATPDDLGPVAHWELLGAWQLLHGLPWTPATVAALHPGIEVLVSPAHQELAITLATYLDSGGDTAATVAALCIHRATFYYRRDRIRGLIGTGWETGWGRVGAHAALTLAAVLDPGLRAVRIRG